MSEYSAHLGEPVLAGSYQEGMDGKGREAHQEQKAETQALPGRVGLGKFRP